jgi:hypothetical protein
MGIKSFFQNLGRGIKRGFNSFVNTAGNVMGNAGVFLQRKALPAIANISNQVAGGIGKAMPVIAGVAPELAGTAEEAQNVLSKVGSGVGQFAKFIGSDAPRGRMATPEEQAQFRSQIPQGKSFFGIKPLPSPMPAPAPKPSMLANMPMPKGLISPAPSAILARAPLGSDPNTYSPVKVPSGIEAPASAPTANILKAGAGGNSMLAM